MSQKFPNWVKVEAIKSWQKDPRIHSLTCRVQSSHPDLIPFVKEGEVVLKCIECGTEQTGVPEVVISKYLNETGVVTKATFFKYEEFQPPSPFPDGGMIEKQYGVIKGLDSTCMVTTPGETPIYYHLMKLDGSSGGVLFPGDFIVWSDKGLDGVYGPEDFKEIFTPQKLKLD